MLLWRALSMQVLLFHYITLNLIIVLTSYLRVIMNEDCKKNKAFTMQDADWDKNNYHSWAKFKIILLRKPEGKLYYFHAAVVFVTSQTLLFRLALAILWIGALEYMTKNVKVHPFVHWVLFLSAMLVCLVSWARLI